MDFSDLKDSRSSSIDLGAGSDGKKQTKEELLLQAMEEMEKKMEEYEKQIEKMKKGKELKVIHKEDKCYDYVYDIEGLAGGVEGWEVFNYSGDLEEKTDIYHALTTCVIGLFGTGKSYVLSKITNSIIPNGPNLHTRGLSVKTVPVPGVKGIIKEYVDFAGFQSCVSMKNGEDGSHNKLLMNKKRDEEFIIRLALRLCNVPIIVVSQITMPQQLIIEEVKDEMRNSKGVKEMFVIHNLKDISQKDELQEYIMQNFRSFYDVQEIEISPSSGSDTMITFYQEERESGFTRSNDPIVRHFFLGREGTPAGEKNEAVFRFFRTVEIRRTGQVNPKSFKTRLMEQLNDLVHRFVNQVPSKDCVVYEMNKSPEKVEDEGEEEEEEGSLVKRSIPKCVRGRLRFKVEPTKDQQKMKEEGKTYEQRITYKWHPNICSCGRLPGPQVGTTVMGGGAYKPANDRVTVRMNNINEGKLCYRIILDVPGITHQTMQQVKRGDLRFEEKQIEVAGVAYGLWKILYGAKILKVKTDIESTSGGFCEYHQQERRCGEWEQSFKLSLQCRPETMEVIVGDGIVTFSCEMFEDDE